MFFFSFSAVHLIFSQRCIWSWACSILGSLYRLIHSICSCKDYSNSEILSDIHSVLYYQPRNIQGVCSSLAESKRRAFRNCLLYRLNYANKWAFHVQFSNVIYNFKGSEYTFHSKTPVTAANFKMDVHSHQRQLIIHANQCFQ